MNTNILKNIIQQGLVRNLHLIFFILFISISFYSCNNGKAKLDAALELAGENRAELEKVLTLYSSESKDSLKLKAAEYLIENMPYHFTDEEYFLSPKGERYRPDLSQFKDNIAVQNHCDSLINSGYRTIKNKLYDIKSIKSDYLIKNIELAFAAWQTPWSKDVPFSEFCRYILPYRAQVENTSNLREELMLKYLPLLDSANVTTPLEACTVLNQRLKGIMKYKKRGLPFYPTIDETYSVGISECEGLCNLGAFIMRSVGIPVAIDQTVWVKMDLGHSWCSVWDNGKFHSFGAGEDDPSTHSVKFRTNKKVIPAKVYRSRFDPYIDEGQSADDGYITSIKSPLWEDVTSQYSDNALTFDIAIDRARANPNAKSNLAYLCTFNFQTWKVLAIGQINDTICTFNDVVGDNIFIIAEAASRNNLNFITAPFYLSKDGDIRKFIPRKDSLKSYTFKKRTREIERLHTLRYWDLNQNSFIPINYLESGDSTQTYNNIPLNSLLTFTVPGVVFNQRQFYFENDSIVNY